MKFTILNVYRWLQLTMYIGRITYITGCAYIAQEVYFHLTRLKTILIFFWLVIFNVAMSYYLQILFTTLLGPSLMKFITKLTLIPIITFIKNKTCSMVTHAAIIKKTCLMKSCSHLPNVFHYAILIYAVSRQICHILKIIFKFCQLTFLLLPSLKHGSMISHVIYIPFSDTILLSNIAVINVVVV